VVRWLLERGRLMQRIRVRRARVEQLEGRRARLQDGSTLEAGCLVLAAGLDARRLAPGLPLRARKGHLVITDRHPGLVKHQLVELDYIQNAHGTATESVAFNVQPRPNGQLLIGSSRQFDEESRAIDPVMLSRIVARAVEFLPRLGAASAIRAWTGLRAATPDGQPIIGGHQRHPGLYAACGHEGLGITTALGTAALVRAAVTGSAPPIDPSPYAWERFDE
jgi:glycine/D-amino acid oxidase-like deaminating enzyme